MSDEYIIRTLCVVSLWLFSVAILYSLVSLYKVKNSLLWIKSRFVLTSLIILTGFYSILCVSVALYASIEGDAENIVLVSLLLFPGAIFIFIACSLLTGTAAGFDRNQLLEQENISDESMGIYNRAYFVLRLKEEYGKAKRHDLDFSVLLIAVDYFEQINSSYGAQYASKFIKRFSELIRQSVRETDITARFGGEEVVILLQNTGIDGARIAARKIQNVIENKTFYIDTGDELNQIMIACTVSIGVATYSSSMKNSDQIIEQADVALFKARDRGRNQVAVYGE